jgi:hypothetical protein
VAVAVVLMVLVAQEAVAVAVRHWVVLVQVAQRILVAVVAVLRVLTMVVLVVQVLLFSVISQPMQLQKV